MEDRVHRVLDPDDVAAIAAAYHAWRGDGNEYEDVPGFCKAAGLDGVRGHGHVPMSGRYVGVAEAEAAGEPFAE